MPRALHGRASAGERVEIAAALAELPELPEPPEPPELLGDVPGAELVAAVCRPDHRHRSAAAAAPPPP